LKSETEFKKRVKQLFDEHKALIEKPNRKLPVSNGVFDRYENPVLTAAHAPIFWRYDLNRQTNPLLLERMGINSAFNVGAIEFENKICLIARVEGKDRKSFFAVAESSNGIDNFRFWDYPVQMPPAQPQETNVYDMRLTRHEDGNIYGVFCAESHDESQPNEPSAAIARCGIARTKDLKHWERLKDLKTPSAQQRNAVLHPEFINGKYGFYTRPMSDFKSTGASEGIGFGLCVNIEQAVITEEIIMDPCTYHTVNEGKNGQGPAPIKTDKGWLHLAHGVRDTAAGYRYVLYMFLTDPAEPWKVIVKPGGYFLAPKANERLGDVSNVVFSNGWVLRDNGEIFIYYGSSDTRTHVATTSIGKLLDYCLNTPPDGLKSYKCIEQRTELIKKNLNNPWWKNLEL
jgi:4-O-beta-D-mannosyl-D-glucose phosphorylase